MLTRRLLFNKGAAMSEMVVVEVGVPLLKTAGVGNLAGWLLGWDQITHSKSQTVAWPDLE
jgi:hypothetical protein